MMLFGKRVLTNIINVDSEKHRRCIKLTVSVQKISYRHSLASEMLMIVWQMQYLKCVFSFLITAAGNTQVCKKCTDSRWPAQCTWSVASIEHDDRFCSASQRDRNMSTPFLPRCIPCRRGLAMRILSVSLSVRLSHA